MRCFYHPSADAVGTCKNCHRGLCRDCAAERDAGLACRGRCEAAVDAVSALIRRNVQMTSGATWTVVLRLLAYWGLCAAMLYIGFTQQETNIRLLSFGFAGLTFVVSLSALRWLVKAAAKKPQ